MISEILIQILKLSFSASILIGILLLSVPLLQKRYRAKWRYVVWLVISIRLLIPVGISLPQAPISFELPEQAREAVYTPTMSKSEPSEAVALAPPENIQQGVPAWSEADNAAQDLSTYEAGQARAATFSPIEIAGFIWLVGVIVFLLVQVCSYQIFLRRLKAAKTETVPAFMKEIVWQIGADMGVCNLPKLIITNAIDAPLLIGLIHPRMLIPHAQYGYEELSFILRHELVHYRRGDMLYKLLLMAANALHWFNPMVYLMTAQAARDIELACDDDVTRGLDYETRARYGDTILSALPKKRRPEPMFSTHFGSGKKNMKGRLRNLFDTAAKRRGTASLCAVVICAGIVTSFVSLGYAADSVITEETASVSVTFQSVEKTTTVQKPIQSMTVRAEAYDGTWAAASSIEGKTWQEQINDEIKWLNDTYEENKSGFVITEAMPESEVSNVSRINYLYDNSRVFRDMSKMNDGFYAVENGQSFTGSGFTLTTDMIHRTVVMTDNDNDLYLDVDYNLTEGRMAVWLIDPNGEIAYQGSLNSTYKGVRTISGKKGLWSVVRVNQSNSSGKMSGNIAINLRQDGAPQAVSTPITGAANDITAPTIENGQPYFQIVSYNGKNAINSGSFVAKATQKLTISAKSSIKGGTVDLFLFSPSGKEQRFTFGGSDKTVTVELTAGTWAYNCTGFYESGNIVITGVFENTPSVGAQVSKSNTEEYDNEAIRRMNASGTWGDYINQLLPNMSPGAIDVVVDIYLDRHLFPNVTTPEGARQVTATIAPALEYMTKESKEAAEKRVSAYY